MPRGQYDRTKSTPRRKTTGTVTRVDWYEFFYNFYDLYNCNKEKTLLAYKLYKKDGSSGSTPSHLFSQHKHDHAQEWEQARKDYFEDNGVTVDNIYLAVADIAYNGKYEKNRLEALRFLYDILTTQTIKDNQTQAQRIIVQVEGSANPSAIVSTSDIDIQEE